MIKIKKINFKSKKGDMEPLVKLALWILVFVGISAGIYFLFQALGGMV